MLVQFSTYLCECHLEPMEVQRKDDNQCNCQNIKDIKSTETAFKQQKPRLNDTFMFDIEQSGYRNRLSIQHYRLNIIKSDFNGSVLQRLTLLTV